MAFFRLFVRFASTAHALPPTPPARAAVKVREAAFASVKILLLQKYLNAQQIEEYLCPASVELLKLGVLPEDVVKERHPDAFVVCANFTTFVSVICIL